MADDAADPQPQPGPEARAGTEPRGREAARLVGTLEGAFSQAATVAGMIAGTVGLLYVIGGTVMWLRFDKAGLPADRAVALVPKNDLLVLGLRVMVLPAVASGFLLLALGSIWRARRARHRRLLQEKAVHVQRLHEAPEGDEAIRERMDQLEERIHRSDDTIPVRERLPTPRRDPVRFLALAAVALLIAAVVPFSVGALAWPVALVGLAAYWLHLRAARPGGTPEDFPVWRLALAAVLAASVISVARQTDPPVELVSVRAELVDPPALLQNALSDSTVRRVGDKRFVDVSGILVAITDDAVNIGDAENHIIASIPRSRVTSMTIGPPLDQRAPPRSLLSKILGESPWAVTPLELWCSNLRYGWAQIGDACQRGPELRRAETLRIRRDRLVGVQVKCPAEAEEGCRGFVLIETERPGCGVATEKALPVSIRPADFVFAEDYTDQVEVPVDERGLWALLTCEEGGAGRGDLRVPVRIVVSREAAGRAVVDVGRSMLVVSSPGDPSPDGGGGDGGDDPPPAGGGGAGGGGGGGGGAPGDGGSPSDGEPSPTPTPEATPTPDASNPLPPQDSTLEAPPPTADGGD